MNVGSTERWSDRLSPTARFSLIALTALVALFAVGMVVGFSYASIEQGHAPMKPMAYITLAAMLALLAGAGWVLRRLVQSVQPDSMSRFDRRYWKMWAILCLVGVPLGIGLALVGARSDVGPMAIMFSNTAIAPAYAVIMAALLTATLLFAAIYYHRIIDDHEERAYLWGSTVGYYFLLLAFPLHWLLARGGLISPLTIGIAMLIILLSTLIQAIVWALFKFR